MNARPDLVELQGTFAQAILRARLTVPGSVASMAGPSRERRFRVYRNNAKASLVAALAARFSIVQRLVGEEFFEATALIFAEHHPPRSPVLAEYGARFASFLEGFNPVRNLPYLADVARLEWSRHKALHAADAASIGIERLAALDAAALETTHLTLHPAALAVASPWPIVSIWSTNMYDEQVRRIGPDRPGEIALVTRPDEDVLVSLLPPGADLAVAAIAAGAALGEAMARAQHGFPDFDVATLLAVLFHGGAISALQEGTSA